MSRLGSEESALAHLKRVVGFDEPTLPTVITTQELPDASRLTKKLFYLIQQLLIDKHEIDFEISKVSIEGKCMLLAECKRYSVSSPNDAPIPFSIKLPLEDVEMKIVIGTYIAIYNAMSVNMTATPDELFERNIPLIANIIVGEIDRQIREAISRRLHNEIKKLSKNFYIISAHTVA